MVKNHKHQINFQTTFRHKVSHNLDPDALLEVKNMMKPIAVREALLILHYVIHNRLLTGIERTRGRGTLLMFDAGFAAQVEESTRDITHTLEVITGMQLSAEIRETLTLGENDTRWDAPSNSS